MEQNKQLIYLTRTKPDRPGYYWCMPDDESRRLQVVIVTEGKAGSLVADGVDIKNCTIETLEDYRWCPMPEPFPIRDVTGEEPRCGSKEF